MVEFQHVITDREGFHARPVTSVCACVMRHTSTVRIACGARETDAHDLMGLMQLDARCGDTLRVVVEGDDEQEAARDLKAVMDAEL